ncbi:hypothetical protein, partial [Azospirillum isscasi]
MADERVFEDRIANAVSVCVDSVSELAADPYLREAVMKMAVREFSWAILSKRLLRRKLLRFRGNLWVGGRAASREY